MSQTENEGPTIPRPDPQKPINPRQPSLVDSLYNAGLIEPNDPPRLKDEEYADACADFLVNNRFQFKQKKIGDFLRINENEKVLIAYYEKMYDGFKKNDGFAIVFGSGGNILPKVMNIEAVKSGYLKVKVNKNGVPSSFSINSAKVDDFITYLVNKNQLESFSQYLIKNKTKANSNTFTNFQMKVNEKKAELKKTHKASVKETVPSLSRYMNSLKSTWDQEAGIVKTRYDEAAYNKKGKMQFKKMPVFQNKKRVRQIKQVQDIVDQSREKLEKCNLENPEEASRILLGYITQLKLMERELGGESGYLGKSRLYSVVEQLRSEANAQLDRLAPDNFEVTKLRDFEEIFNIDVISEFRVINMKKINAKTMEVLDKIQYRMDRFVSAYLKNPSKEVAHLNGLETALQEIRVSDDVNSLKNSENVNAIITGIISKVNSYKSSSAEKRDQDNVVEGRAKAVVQSQPSGEGTKPSRPTRPLPPPPKGHLDRGPGGRGVS